MPLAQLYDVSRSENDLLNILDTLNNDRRLENVLADTEVKIQTAGVFVKLSGFVQSWARKPVNQTWPNVYTPWTVQLGGTLHDMQNTNAMIRDILDNRVLILESRTGAGKSCYTPSWLFQAMTRIYHGNMERDINGVNGFRVIHLVPTGEQVHQNYEHTVNVYAPFGVHVGAYSSALNHTGTMKNHLHPGITNYLYATYFFAAQALAGNTLFHAIVIDEVHDVTPTVIKLLDMAREKLKNRQVNRVLLLSATMSPDLKAKIKAYFSGIDHCTIGETSRGDTPYPIVIEPFNGPNQYSQQAAIAVHGTGITNRELFDAEKDTFGGPDMEVLRNRAIRLATAKLARFMQLDVNQLPRDYGILVFMPGNSDVVKAKNEIVNFIRFSQMFREEYCKVYTVTGVDRSDLKILENPRERAPIRVVISTPLLQTGVTVLGVSTIVDTGTYKYPSNHNRYGISHLIVDWMDGYTRKQRLGRVGRVATGEYFEVFTTDRRAEMDQKDHWRIRLQAAFETSDLHFIFSRAGNLMKPPIQNVYNDLVIEAGVLGFYPTRRPPILDHIGGALSRCWNLPLDSAMFIVVCNAMGLFLPGLVFTASKMIEHRGLKPPNERVDQFGRSYGRDSTHFSLNCWETLTGRKHKSDLIEFIVLMTNLVLREYPSMQQDLRPGSKVFLPDQVKDWRNEQAMEETHHHMMGIMFGCRALGIGYDMVDLVAKHNCRMELLKPSVGVSYLELRPDGEKLLSYAITMCFGHRVLEIADRSLQRGHQHTTWTIPNCNINAHALQVQGERMSLSPPGTMAIYTTIYQRDNDERHDTTHLHQISPSEYLLYGNAYGSINDRLNDSGSELIIFGNTGSFKFVSKIQGLLKKIHDFRLKIRGIPILAMTNQRQFVPGIISQMLKIDFQDIDVVMQPNFDHRRQLQIDHVDIFSSNPPRDWM